MGPVYRLRQKSRSVFSRAVILSSLVDTLNDNNAGRGKSNLCVHFFYLKLGFAQNDYRKGMSLRYYYLNNGTNFIFSYYGIIIQ